MSKRSNYSNFPNLTYGQDNEKKPASAMDLVILHPNQWWVLYGELAVKHDTLTLPNKPVTILYSTSGRGSDRDTPGKHFSQGLHEMTLDEACNFAVAVKSYDFYPAGPALTTWLEDKYFLYKLQPSLVKYKPRNLNGGVGMAIGNMAAFARCRF